MIDRSGQRRLGGRRERGVTGRSRCRLFLATPQFSQSRSRRRWHFPPGTSKWNKIEHRLFCHITTNGRGRALRTFETIVDLIVHTSTATGLRVRAKLDKRRDRLGVKVTAAEMRDVALHRHEFHGDWNYEIHPRTT